MACLARAMNTPPAPLSDSTGSPGQAGAPAAAMVQAAAAAEPADSEDWLGCESFHPLTWMPGLAAFVPER